VAHFYSFDFLYIMCDSNHYLHFEPFVTCLIIWFELLM
jgi:hypothetical protein